MPMIECRNDRAVARARQGVVGLCEREARDDDERQRIAADVDAFPQRLGADQH